MSVPLIISVLLFLLGWGLLIGLARAVDRGPREDFASRLSWRIAQIYARVWHRLRIEGAEHIPAGRTDPLVIIANHTCGADPLLIQSVLPFYVRWMMMREMMLPLAGGLWAWLEIIPVEQNGRDSGALRAAIRHLERGGVIGVFPEGGVSRPHGTIMPYQPGVGLLALRQHVRVLPMVIRGTPRCENAFVSVLMPSRATLRFLPVRSYAGSGMNAQQVADALRAEAMRELGWPASPES